jgi:hypothetical protein
MKLCDGPSQLRRQRGELILSDKLRIDAQSFANSVQVRRRVEPAADSRCLEDAVKHRRGRALTFRSGEVNGGEGVLGAPQQLAEPFHSGEIEVAR